MSQGAFNGSYVVPIVVARSFEAAGMPAGLQVERPAQRRKARVHIPVPCKRNSSAIVLHPIVALLLEFYGECRWEYIGNQRIRIPPDQPQGRLRILINPCRHFAVRICDECRWNYILKEDEVPGSNPGGSNRRGHSSTVERV